MDRRDFLKTAAAASAATTVGLTATSTPALAAPSLARGMRQWVLALPQSLDTLEVRTVVARLQHQIAAARPHTSVMLEPTVSGGLEAVTTGFADLYIGIDTQHDAAHPALPIFAGLPASPDRGHDMSAAVHRAWLAGPGRALWSAALDTVDVVAMPVAHTGPSPGLYSDVAFETGQDVRGLRIGARGFAADALRLLGATVSTGDADGAGALAGRGLVAAEPLLAPFETQAQWSYQPGLTPAGLSISLGARGSFWRSLAASDQAVIAAIADATSAASLELGARRQESLDQVAAFRRWPMHTATPAAFARDVAVAMSAVIDDLAARDALARRAIDSLRHIAARVS